MSIQCRIYLGLLLVFPSLSMAAKPMAEKSMANKSVDELVQYIDTLWQGDSSHTLMEMQVTTPHYQRVLTLEGWSKGKHKALLVIKSPKKDAGISTLKSDKNVWNYLPKINRVTKVPSSMMSGSWMGSHFTHDDLVRESSLIEDYSSTLTFEGERDNKLVYEITLIPKPEAPVIWGKVVLFLQQKELLPLKLDYFDEDLVLTRRMTFSNPRQIQGKLIPHRLTLIPMEKPDESTVVHYHRMDLNILVDDGLFSLLSLKKKRF